MMEDDFMEIAQEYEFKLNLWILLYKFNFKLIEISSSDKKQWRNFVTNNSRICEKVYKF